MWWWYIDGLFVLKEGGYPFQPNDLTVEAWRDMGIYKQQTEAMQWQKREP